MTDILPYVLIAGVILVAVFLTDRQVTRHLKPRTNDDLEAIRGRIARLEEDHAKTRRQANTCALQLGLQSHDRGL